MDPIPPPVTIFAHGSGDAAGFVSATFLPHRAMMLLQLRARWPGLGEIDVLAAPPLEAALARLSGAGEDAFGNASFAFGGSFLAPFVNRLTGALLPGRREISADLGGQSVRLPANWGGKRAGAARYSMHGLMRELPAGEISRAEVPEGERLTARLPAGDFGGCWPGRTEIGFSFTLTPQAFAAEVTARNVGEAPVPMALGWHPYFRVPSGRRATARLKLPAATRLEVNDYDEVLPTGRALAAAGTAYDFAGSNGRALGEAYLDDCFTDMARAADGGTACALVDPEAGYGLVIDGNSPAILAVQVYAPPAEAFVAIEPQTSFADPFGPEWAGRDTGIRRLAPGETLAYPVRLSLFRP